MFPPFPKYSTKRRGGATATKKGGEGVDKFRVTKDQRVYLGEKEITHCTGFKIIAKAGDDPEVELRAIVESVDIEGFRSVPTQTGSQP